MKPCELEAGDLVQLNPDTTRNQAFAAMFMVVTEPKNFGAMGYVPVLGERNGRPGGQAYYRANWEEMELVGRAEWVLGDDDDGTNSDDSASGIRDNQTGVADNRTVGKGDPVQD